MKLRRTFDLEEKKILINNFLTAIFYKFVILLKLMEKLKSFSKLMKHQENGSLTIRND